MYPIQICWHPLHCQTYTCKERERERQRQRESCIYTSPHQHSPWKMAVGRQLSIQQGSVLLRTCCFADMRVKNPWLNCCQTGPIKPVWPYKRREHLSKTYQEKKQYHKRWNGMNIWSNTDKIWYNKTTTPKWNLTREANSYCFVRWFAMFHPGPLNFSVETKRHWFFLLTP